MTIVTQNRIEYKVFESLTEIEGHGIKYYKTLTEISDGDYLQTNNGLYVPLIHKREYLRKYYHSKGQKHLRPHPVKAFFYTFPRQKLVTVENGTDRSFSYSPQVDSHKISPCGNIGKSNKVIKPEYRYFVECIHRGLSIRDAVKATYPKLVRSNQITMKLHTLLNQHIIIESIFKEDFMKSIKDELIESGINNHSIACEIYDLVNNRNANPMLRKWALEQAMYMLREEKEVNNILKQASTMIAGQIHSFHSS